MTPEERKLKKQNQWRVVEIIKPGFSAWLFEQDFASRFNRVEFLPHGDSLEIYFFYNTKKDVEDGEIVGYSQLIKNRILDDITRVGSPELVVSSVKITFDSHENVLQDYAGNYYNQLK